MNWITKIIKAGEKISNEIFKPVWQFDSRWTCVFRGDK